MIKFVLPVVLCLLSGVVGATFELKDPAQPDEDAKTGKPIKYLNKDTSVAVKNVIVPASVELIQPDIENNKCVGFSSDPSELNADGSSGSLTSKTYIGKAISSTKCPAPGSSKTFTLVQTSDGRLIWVDSSRLLDAK